MRTFLLGTLIVTALVVATGALWWNSTRIEAWAEQTKTDWRQEQERERVRNADVFLHRGLKELDCEVARLEQAQFEQRVGAEEARLRASKHKDTLAEAEHLAGQFAAAMLSANGKAFGFYGRTYTAHEAERQFDSYAREVLGLRDGLGELNYNEVAHRNAAEHLAEAAAKLREAREKAQREGQRMIVDRDVADAKALATALNNPGIQANGELGGTLKALRDHVLRRNAESNVNSTPDIDQTLQRKRQTERDDQVRQLKSELLERSRQ